MHGPPVTLWGPQNTIVGISIQFYIPVANNLTKSGRVDFRPSPLNGVKESRIVRTRPLFFRGREVKSGLLGDIDEIFLGLHKTHPDDAGKGFSGRKRPFSGRRSQCRAKTAGRIGLKFSEVALELIVHHYSVLTSLENTGKWENSTLWLT